MRALLVLAIACGGTTPPHAPARTEPRIPLMPPTTVAPEPEPEPFVEPSFPVITVKAGLTVSRLPASARVLRGIVAARRGAVELSSHYQIGLEVHEVVSGTLADPNYAKRPRGPNSLPVVLVDEAAYADQVLAEHGRSDYRGQWRLTRLPDGTFIVSSIADTPFHPDLVADRRLQIMRARKNLRSPLVDDRLAGLEFLANRSVYELVPDAIALVQDWRVGASGEIVAVTAHRVLTHLTNVLGDETRPTEGRADAWAQYWRALTTRPVALPPIVETTATELVTLASPQRWTRPLALANGALVLAVRDLDTPIDKRSEGLLLQRTKRAWITKTHPANFDAIVGPAGIAVVHSDGHWAWQFKIVDAKGKHTPAKIYALHAALAPSETGYLLATATGAGLLALYTFDARGVRTSEKSNTLPNTNVQQIQHLSVTRKRDGWLATIRAKDGMVIANVDEWLTVQRATLLHGADVFGTSAIVAAKDQAFVTWTHAKVLLAAVLDLEGRLASKITWTGSEVTAMAKPVALDDGFAAAWIEVNRELHVGRWNLKGERIANDVIAIGELPTEWVSLARDGNALVVTYEDQTRYPSTVIARRMVLQ